MERSDLIELLSEHACAGERGSRTGTVRLGHAPIVAPLAYLHVVFAPLEHDEVQALQEELPVMIPEPYRQFLALSNGLDLFVGSVALYGVRQHSARDLSALDWPFSLLTANLTERPRYLEKGRIVIGSYNDDHSSIVMHHASPKVQCTTPEGDQIRAEWPNLGAFLREEVTRIHALLAPNFEGLRIGRHTRTLPGEFLPIDIAMSQPQAKRWWHFW